MTLAPRARPTLDEVFARLCRLVTDRCSDGAPSSVLRVEMPRVPITWELAAGTVSRSDRRPAQPTSPFRIASITKMFTAVTAVQLAVSSLVPLDDAVSHHLPADVAELLDGLLMIDGRSYGRTVTVRHLLEHSSGLDDHAASAGFLSAIAASPGRRWTARELLLEAQRSSTTPSPPSRRRFRYSDTGYVILGLLIEHVYGVPLHQVLRQRILEPLGLGDTWLEGYEDPVGEPVTHAYLGDVDTMTVHGSADWAAGGLVSTARDLSAFMRALLDGRLLDEPTRDQLLRYRPDRIEPHQRRHGLLGYGLGIEIRQRSGRTLCGHLGLWGAFAYAHVASGATITGTVNRSGDEVHRFLDGVVATLGEFEMI